MAMHGGSVVVAGLRQVSGFNYDFALAATTPTASFDTPSVETARSPPTSSGGMTVREHGSTARRQDRG